MQKLKSVLPIMFALVILLASSLPGVSAHSGDVLSAFGTATVDGVISAGEYGSSIGPITKGDYTFTIYETNDLQNDYYAFTINDLTNDGEMDELRIYFDNEHDGIVPQYTDPALIYEDAIEALGDGTFSDRHYGMISGAFQAPTDSVQDGAAATTWTEDQGYVYEMSHPLNSGDPRDYSLSTGSTVGWGLTYFDWNERAYVYVYYPTGFNVPAGSGDASKYGDILKTGAPVGGVAVPVNKLAILTPYLALLGLSVAVTTAVAIRRRKT